MIHQRPHPMAGQAVILKPGFLVFPWKPFDDAKQGPTLFKLEDWVDRVLGKSWMLAAGNPAAILFALRSGHQRLPIDDEVVYGKIGGAGALIHVSEIHECEGKAHCE